MIFVRALIVAALACAWPITLAAQTTEGGSGGGSAPQGGDSDGDGAPLTRPFRGLFGLADSGRTGVALVGDLFGAYDDNVAATLPGRAFDPRYQRSGWYSGASAQVQWNWRGERAGLNGWAGGGTNYYPDFSDPFVPSYSAGIGFDRPIGRRNSFRVGQTFQYSPYSLGGLFAGVPGFDDSPLPPIALDPSSDVSGNTIARYSTSVGFTRQLSRASTFTAGYAYSQSDYQSFDRTYRQQHGSVMFTRRLTRHANLRLGYGYRSATSEVGLPGEPRLTNEMQDIQAGVDYNRSIALSMTRRTRVSFSTGTSYLGRTDLSGSELDERRRSRFYVTGTAELAHEMGRTWQTGLVYRRAAGFSELAFEPIVSDSLTASLSGLLARRIEFSAQASATTGHVGDFVRENDDYTSYRATAQLRRAITRHLAARVAYVYYQHDFGNQVRLPLGFPQALERNGVQFGINAWIPIR